MINNPKVIVMERPSGDFAIAVTDGSSDFHDAQMMVVASHKENGEDFIDTMESVLFFAAKRILELEKGGYSPPPLGEGRDVSLVPIQKS
ncbi:hypothetical protein [Mixta sp. Marseille-Q2659]|uniref:hypothetical protein n=1 Tax=Mixta sp. Marseille-Q2659 TaxID=2736607 RepID=UPI0023B96151|nr:hypothetical protein [Mixta sp. Marseille-Q2659]